MADITIQEQIEILGDSFRGLWKSVILEDKADDYLKDGWSVTFIYYKFKKEYNRVAEDLSKAQELLRSIGK